MKNTFRKSMALLAFVAIFAMILTGCKKDSSSSSGGGGNGGGGGGGGQYGSITVGDQHYGIAVGFQMYDSEDDTFLINLFDKTDLQHANQYGISIAGVHTLAEAIGSYTFTMQEPNPAGTCMAGLTSGSNSLVCVSGSVTIAQGTSGYTIQADGTARAALGSRDMPFTVDFEGPLQDAR